MVNIFKSLLLNNSDESMEREKLKVFGFSWNKYKRKLGENEKPDYSNKCLECNNEADVLYVIAKDEKEAVKLLEYGKDGVCGECLSARLIEMGQNGYVITK